LVSYLDVVIAQRDLLADQQQLAIIQGNGLVSSVLCEALGALGRIQPRGRAGQTQPKTSLRRKLHLERTFPGRPMPGVANHFSEDSLAAIMKTTYEREYARQRAACTFSPREFSQRFNLIARNPQSAADKTHCDSLAQWDSADVAPLRVRLFGDSCVSCGNLV